MGDLAPTMISWVVIFDFRRSSISPVRAYREVFDRQLMPCRPCGVDEIESIPLVPNSTKHATPRLDIPFIVVSGADLAVRGLMNSDARLWAQE